MIPLATYSNYSLLTGAFRINELLEKVQEEGIHSVALTDLNAMYGLIQFSKLALEKGIKPIFGCTLDEHGERNTKIVLLARNREGYSDLCKLITMRKLNDDFNLADVVSEYWSNLVFIISELNLLKIVNKRNKTFAGLIVTKSNKKNAREIYNFASENNIPLIAANPVYFIDEKDHLLHKTLTAIKLNTTLNALSQNDLVDEEYYFHSVSKMTKMFKAIPEAIENTLKISELCNVDLKLNEYKYPVYPDLGFETSINFLNKLAFEGLAKRYTKINDKISDRLKYELGVINELNFSDYFLIVWDIVKEAKKRGMVTIGRGSAANSLVAYCLFLTEVDPVKHNLYFERFLNKARSSPPDVDIDFSWKERDEIIKYVFEKYGYERVAMISTHVTFKARSAFREVAKVFGITDPEISKYSKRIPWTDAANLPNISELFPESKNLNFKIEPWKTIVDLAVKIANFPRHLSIHPGGIVITPTRVTDYCALEYAKNKGLGLIITQPDMYSVEDLGLIKIDLLSQRSLGVLRDTMKQIQENLSGD